jgi:hypothetical protein
MTFRRDNPWLYRNSKSEPSLGQPVASNYTDWAIASPARTWVQVIHSSDWQHGWRRISGLAFRNTRPWHNYLDRLKEATGQIPAEIRTQHLSNWNVELYRCVNPLVGCRCVTVAEFISSCTPKMEAAYFPKRWLSVYQTALRHVSRRR